MVHSQVNIVLVTTVTTYDTGFSSLTTLTITPQLLRNQRLVVGCEQQNTERVNVTLAR